MRRTRVFGLFRFFYRDLGWKLFSLALAVLLWIFAASEPTVYRFVNAPVQFKDLTEGLEISSELIESVYLEVQGPANLQPTGGDENYAVVLDMSRARPGEHTFTIGPGDVRLPRGTSLVRAVPSQLRFEFERRSSKMVPVRVRFGTPQAGYEIVCHEVSPASLRIVGPESRVARVQAVTTDLIDVSQVVGTSEFRVTAFVEDPQIRFAEPPRVAVKVEVRARAEASAHRPGK